MDVFYAHGLINLHVYSSKHKFDRVLEDSLRVMKSSGITTTDIREAKDKIIRSLAYDGVSFREANRDILSTAMLYEFQASVLIKFIKENSYSESDLDVKLHTNFLFLEGDIDRSDAERLYDIVGGSFKM